MIIKRIWGKLKLCFKSLQNRLARHSQRGTEKQVKNIVEIVKKNPRMYSKKREVIFKEALENRKKGV